MGRGNEETRRGDGKTEERKKKGFVALVYVAFAFLFFQSFDIHHFTVLVTFSVDMKNFNLYSDCHY